MLGPGGRNRVYERYKRWQTKIDPVCRRGGGSDQDEQSDGAMYNIRWTGSKEIDAILGQSDW